MAVAVLALGVAGCSNDTDEPAGLDATSQPSETSDSTSGQSDADDAAAVEQLYTDYWDAMVAAENGPSADPALFESIVAGNLVEQKLSTVQQMIDDGQERFGEPEIGEVEVTVDGDTARAIACVDQRPWRVVVQGQTQPPHEVKPAPIGVNAERTDNGWTIVEQFAVEEESTSC